jgi:hypothetical protein
MTEHNNAWVLLERSGGWDAAMTRWLLHLCGASTPEETVEALGQDKSATAMLDRTQFLMAVPALARCGVYATEMPWRRADRV